MNSTRVECSSKDVLRAVISSDRAPGDVLHHDAERVADCTLRTLAFAALDRQLVIDLGNGHALVCSTYPITKGLPA